MQTLQIRDPEPVDEPRWRELWQGYYRFYDKVITGEITAATWRRMLDPASAIHGRLAERKGRVLGFSIYVLHEATWTLGPACYLEDLYVDPTARQMGIGAALIQDLIDMGRSNGWSKLYWHTRQGNTAACRLYDRFCLPDDFIRYRMALD